MYNENELIQALHNAHDAGDTQAAQHLSGVIQQQRQDYANQNNIDISIVGKFGIDETEKKLIEFGRDTQVKDDYSGLEKVAIGLGRGFTDIGQGAQQIIKEGGNAKLPEHLKFDFNNLDKRVQEETKQFNDDFQGDLYAKGGQLAGQTIATAPIGGAVGSLAKTGAAATRTGNALNMAKQGALVGATEAGLMPVLGDNFTSEKLAQVGLGAGFGGTLGAGLGAVKGTKELLNDGVGATVSNALGKGGKNGISKAILGNSDDIAERSALYARNPDVIASQAQKSGSNFDKIMEEWGKSNVFLSDQAEDMASKELSSLKNWIEGQAKNISNTTNPTETTFSNIQKLPKKITNKLVKERSETGRKLYGQVHNFAQGQRVVGLNNVKKAMLEIIDDTKGVQGSDLQKIANQAKKMSLAFDNGYTAKQAHNQLKAWSSHGSGRLFKDIESFGADDRAKKMLHDALLKDMDSVDGDLGQLLKQANTAWRTASGKIDQVEAGIFGKIAGKELQQSADGFLNNTIPPEQVLQKVRTASPTQVNALMKYFNKYDDKLGKEFQAQYLNNAIDESMVGANTAGMELTFNPTTFLNSLGITKGKKGWEGTKRLRAIYGNDPKAQTMINDMLAMTRNAGDAFGKNFSGTASHNFLNDMFSSMQGFFSGTGDLIKTATSTLSHYLGSRKILENAYNAKPFVKTIGSIGNTARNATALLTPTVVNQIDNNRRNEN